MRAHILIAFVFFDALFRCGLRLSLPMKKPGALRRVSKLSAEISYPLTATPNFRSLSRACNASGECG